MSFTTLDDMLAALHPTQRTAVTHPARPLLLACGPGSGKTRILTHRIQWLVQQERVDPVAILALTFSRAAADELRGRLVRALGPLARALWAGTFHGFGAWLLRRHGARLGRTAAFTIFDREDTRRLIGRLMQEVGLEGDVATLVDAVERAKGQPTPEAGPAAASRLGPLAALLAAYETRCREANAFDFTDLLAAPLALFHQDPAVRAGLRTRFRALLVDEAQDLCGLQHALVEALAAPDGAVTFAGRRRPGDLRVAGGDVTRLHAFERTYPGGTVLAVGRNYRSTPEIVATAARLIGHNRARRPKPLAAVRPGGPRPEVLTWADDRAEAEGLAGRCPEWLRTSALADRDPGAGDGVPDPHRPGLRGAWTEGPGPRRASTGRARRSPRPTGGLSRARQPARLARVGAGAARASLRRGGEDARHAPSPGPGDRRGPRPPGGGTPPAPAGGTPGSTPGLADESTTGHDPARHRRGGDPASSLGRENQVR